MQMTSDDIRSLIRDVRDFPTPGIVFKDLTPVMRDARAFSSSVDRIAESFSGQAVTAVASMESRGFIFGGAVACRLGCGFIPIRKRGKLPREKVSVEYQLEYGTDVLEMHADAVGPGDRVLIVDDVLATGGTAAAVVRLLRDCGATVVGLGFLVELEFLRPREKLPELLVRSVVRY
jgi:adenine phosphoribosyltransferase